MTSSEQPRDFNRLVPEVFLEEFGEAADITSYEQALQFSLDQAQLVETQLHTPVAETMSNLIGAMREAFSKGPFQEFGSEYYVLVQKCANCAHEVLDDRSVRGNVTLAEKVKGDIERLSRNGSNIVFIGSHSPLQDSFFNMLKFLRKQVSGGVNLRYMSTDKFIQLCSEMKSPTDSDSA